MTNPQTAPAIVSAGYPDGVTGAMIDALTDGAPHRASSADPDYTGGEVLSTSILRPRCRACVGTGWAFDVTRCAVCGGVGYIDKVR